MFKLFKIAFISIIPIFMLIGCSNKINNISKKSSYKVLDEVSIIVEQINGDVFRSSTSIMFTGSAAFPIAPIMTFKPVESCKKESDVYLYDITNNISKFQELFQDRNIKIRNINELTKKVLFIKITGYHLENNKTCEMYTIWTDVFLYDVEDVSTNWDKEEDVNILNTISKLNEDRIIYKNKFGSDKYFNSFPTGQFSSDYFFNKNLDKNVEKFYKEVIKHLEEVISFPNK